MTNSIVVKSRIDLLRKKMEKKGADICIITGNDFHMSEYPGRYFSTREYFSGFTGSAGTLIITGDEVYLYTDGRYFIQAEKELTDTGIILMKSGMTGVPDIKDHLKEISARYKEPVLIFDGRTVSAGFGELIKKYTGSNIISVFDPAEDIWNDRPEFPLSEVFYLEERYTGERAEKKLEKIRKDLFDTKADIQVLTSLDDIAWTLNLRGRDIECNPVFMSYLLVGRDDCILFIQDSALTETVKRYLNDLNVIIKDYSEFYSECKKFITENKIFSADKNRIDYSLYELLRDKKTVFKENPTVLLKAVKNEIQIKNLIDVHKEDGACVTRLMMWVKELEDGKFTETDAASYVDSLRKKIKDFFDYSFRTISAFGANAAMMHYIAADDNDTTIRKGGLLLVDSGGHYLRGTTDITRTFAVGEVSDDIKKAYTLTIKGLLALADSVFLKGCSGYNLDILARSPLWKEGLDYRCGTGHGVGYMLNVHESPNSFRWKCSSISESYQLVPGMVTTDEPGVYETGKYGIRIENELLCETAFENEYGTFLRFRVLTLAPIDIDIIDVRYLDKVDIDRLNSYHAMVRNELMPFMTNDKERDFLKKYTKKI